MRYLLTLIVILILSSCGSGKARKFDELLDSTKREVFRILVADSTESRRLQALIDNNPAQALQIGKRQAAGLEAAIEKINQTDISALNDAYQLKITTVKYYQGLLKLKNLDVEEAELMAIQLNQGRSRSLKASTEIAGLVRKRLEIHRVISEVDHARMKAKKKFEQANGLH